MKRRTTTRSYYQHFAKRFLDLCMGIFILIIIWPVLLLIYLFLRFIIGSPVMFEQNRPGFMGKPFNICKFRTMTNQRDTNGNLLPDEQRITKVGKIVRSFSLDELPEIFNVIRGEMSLVGPRPLMMQYIDRYTPAQARRHEVLPGITGWAQINGRNDLSWDEKFKLDVWYVDHLSFMLDVRILAMTFWKVIRREGIDEEGYVSASEFMGSEQKSELPKNGTEENSKK